MEKYLNRIITIPQERIINRILFIRSKKVMIDSDLAELYGVETKALNRAVRRNQKRFPEDFMFQLNKQEVEMWKAEILKYQNGTPNLRSQIGTSRPSWGGRRYAPFAFTEQGVAMLSSVLNSDRAIQVNIQIIRTFTKLREMIATHKELRQKIEAMEKKYDNKLKVVFQVITRLLKDDNGASKKEIGFQP